MRIRTIKPQFFLHDGLFDAERETGLPLRLAFTGLWCAADREGRFKWEPRRLGVAILPYDGLDFSRVLHALLTRGFLVKYRVGSVWIGAVPTFSKHQVINNREAVSQLPDIKAAEEVFTSDKSPEIDASSTPAPRVTHAASGEGKGREGNMEGNSLASAPAVASQTTAPSLILEGDEPEPSMPKPTRTRNENFDALAAINGSDASKLTKPALSAVGVALSQIIAVQPGLTPDEIKRRAGHYRLRFPGAALTTTALAKHWADCEHPPTPKSTAPSWQADGHAIDHTKNF